MTPGDSPPPARRAAVLDRAADERANPGLLDASRADLRSRVIVVRGGEVALAGRARLLTVAPEDVAGDALWAFLGRGDDGAALLAAVLPRDAPDPVAAPGGWSGLREIGGDLAPVEADACVTALSLARWLLEAPHCPACGALTEVRTAGWSRSCPACGREHFPRTDPAVIVAVSSTDGERLLLGSNTLWGQDRYSCFAGFVEAGESLESAVVREVREESGIRVGALAFAGSQPWPYPRSLMVGFHARALDDADARADGEEIAQVRWFDRDDVAAGLSGESDVTLPGRASIAHALIRGWLDGRRA